MSFTVVADASYGPVTPSRCKTEDEALARAVELMTTGLTNVYIIDADGHRFTPGALAQARENGEDEPVKKRA